ncbi:MAG: restriction endonuclease subunit S [Porphyromonadaceae bacterium]|nr:restriction endonuclease subunit S [Porphyromonadaceae bacterium]
MTKLKKIYIRQIGFSQTGPFGSQLHEEDYVSMGTPIVTVEHLGGYKFTTQNLPFVRDDDKNRLSKYILEEGDIVFSRVGSIDRCTYVSKDEAGWLFSGRCLRVRINKEKANPKFVSYYFRQSFFKRMMLNISVGATMPSLNTKLMDNVHLFLPNEKQQQRIASVLSSLDDKIELNNRINTELGTMAKTLYDYWFVQFDFPDNNGKPYKSSGGKMVYSKELKRKIPEVWNVGKIADWILSVKNGDWGKEQEEGNYILKVSCIRGADINGLNNNGELNPPERYILEKNSAKILTPHDVIIEISGGSPTQSTGRMAYLTQETLSRFENPLICSNFCKTISLRNEKYLYNFAFLWNMLYDNGVFFGYEGKTSGIKNFLFDSFVNSYCSVIPREDIVSKFYDFMQDIEKKKQKLLTENQQLASLRDWLLPMLMNGQIGFKEEYQEQAQTFNVAAEAAVEYKKTETPTTHVPQEQDERFELWLSSQGLAARGDIDRPTLREIFNVMDEEEYG